MSQQLFLIDLCTHKDKLVLHCINDILMDFLSMNEISCHKNLRTKNFYLFKGIKCLSIGQET